MRVFVDLLVLGALDQKRWNMHHTRLRCDNKVVFKKTKLDSAPQGSSRGELGDSILR